MAAGIPMQDYLKKYLSKDELKAQEKKIKKKLSKEAAVTIKKGKSKIVDDDIDLKRIKGGFHDVGDIELGEDAPQVIKVIDERPLHIQAEEQFGSSKWRVIGLGENERANRFERLKKQQRAKSDSDESPIRNIVSSQRKRYNSGSDMSPPTQNSDSDLPSVRYKNDITKEKRRVSRLDSDMSPPRYRNVKTKHNRNVRNDSDSDMSPPRRKNDKTKHDQNAIQDSDSDFSPVRKKSDKRRNLEQNSISDSNSRRKPRNESDGSLSSPRHKNSYSRKTREQHRVVRNDSDSDLSPPRQKNSNCKPIIQNRTLRHNSDTLFPRYESKKPELRAKKRTVNEHFESHSLLRKSENKLDFHSRKIVKPNIEVSTDSDQSPQRKRESSRAKKSRHNSDSDQSLVRKTGSARGEKLGHDSDDDQSSIRETDSAKLKKSRHDSDSDQSPVRKMDCARGNKLRQDLVGDQSPIRKTDSAKVKKSRHDFDQFLSRKIEVHKNSDSRHHEPKQACSSGDLNRSPPRKKRVGSQSFQQNNSDSDQSSPRIQSYSKLLKDKEKMKKTLDGKTAGLQKAADMRLESIKRKREEKEMFDKLDKSQLGIGAATIVRDKKTGRKKDLVADARIEKQKELEEAERQAKYVKWGKGLKQLELQEKRLESDLHEMNKPLARYADDADLDKHLREQEREGDPMLKFLKKKKETVGEVVVDDDRPRYKGPYPSNRWGIPPSYRWDGVDRSNGYEKDYLFNKSCK